MTWPHRFLVASLALLLILGGAIWRWRGDNRQPGSIPKEGNGALRESHPSPPDRSSPDTSTLRPSTLRPVSQPWFQTMGPVGIDFQHQSGTSPQKPFPAANGSGIGALDYDLDGQYDLYFLTGTPFPLDSARSSPINRCFRNLGCWKFQDVTRETGLGHNGYSAGVTVGDYNADGFPDVYVACYGANVLYRNMGDGSFQALGVDCGAADDRWATSAAMLDYDADGLLDIYVCNYGKWTMETNQWCGDQARNIRFYCSPKTIEPEIGVLLHNRGDDTFENTTEAAGLAQRVGRAQGVVAADLDGDSAIDLYVGNDLHANSLFINERNGRFRDETESSGAGYDYLGTMRAGMGVDAADANGDGRPELIVTNFDDEANSYFENLGNRLFQEVSQQRGLYTESVPWVGWGTYFGDFDLDGWLDLVVTNGHVDDNRPNIPYAEPPLFWKNTRGRFVFVGVEAGEYFARSHVGRALAVADLDNDGDSDLVIGHQDGPPALLRNLRRSAIDRDRHSLRFRLIGTGSNRDVVGSQVTYRSADHVQVLQVKGGGSYLSAHDLRLLFAVPHAAAAHSLEIRWPDGTQSVYNNLVPDRLYTVIQPSSTASEGRVFEIPEEVCDE